MLKTNKNITISGQSMIGDKMAVVMSATISTDGSSSGNINTNIVDATTYATNKTACRKDISDFQNKVYASQDEMASSSDSSSTSTGASTGSSAS